MDTELMGYSNPELAEERRNEILRAAKRLFERDGFRRTKLKDIAAECGMSVGHIYYYFENKNDIIERIVESATDEFINLMNDCSLNYDGTEESVLKNMGRIVDLFLNKHSSAFILLIKSEALTNPSLFDSLVDAGRRVRECGAKLCYGDDHLDISEEEERARVAVTIGMLEGLRMSLIFQPEVSTEALRKAAIDCLSALMKAGY